MLIKLSLGLSAGKFNIKNNAIALILAVAAYYIIHSPNILCLFTTDLIQPEDSESTDNGASDPNVFINPWGNI